MWAAQSDDDAAHDNDDWPYEDDDNDDYGHPLPKTNKTMSLKLSSYLPEKSFSSVL